MLTMPTLQVHYDGWVSLPPDVRQHLGIVNGDRLEVELTDHGLLLRPTGRTVAPDRAGPADAVAVPHVEAAPEAGAAEAPIKRGPGRPRKLPAIGLRDSIKIGGRRGSKPAV
jgi:bifunctional DNA-binding transcriptional regulator/antitoxin component of YhaV-PrlF toxin-antitoxin module